MNSSNFISGHRDKLYPGKSCQTSPKLSGFIVWSKIIAFQINVFQQRKMLHILWNLIKLIKTKI